MKTIRPIHQVRGALIACGVALLCTAGAALAAEPEHAGRMMHHGESEHEGMGKEDCAHWAHHDHEMKDSMKEHATAEPAQK